MIKPLVTWSQASNKTLARVLVVSADNVANVYGLASYAPLLREAARRLIGLGPTPEGLCRSCHSPLTGRQRDWCSERCRRRHRP